MVARGVVMLGGTISNLNGWTGMSYKSKYRCLAEPIGSLMVGAGLLATGIGFYNSENVVWDDFAAWGLGSCYVGMHFIAIGGIVNTVRKRSINPLYSLQLVTPKQNQIGIALNFESLDCLSKEVVECLTSKIPGNYFACSIHKDVIWNSLNVVHHYSISIPALQIAHIVPVQFIILYGFHPIFPSVIKRYTENGEILVFKLIECFHDIRVFLTAGLTP